MDGMFRDDIVLLESVLDGCSPPMEFSLSFIKYLTADFSQKRELGSAGHGVVYRGKFKNKNIAVKKINMDTDFDREISHLFTVKHKNILQFLGYCHDTSSTLVNVANQGEPQRRSFVYTEQRILCFEYISNGSLPDHIHDELRGLHWHTRYRIIRENFHALDYLHNKKNLVHRYLKPDNILVDNLMTPKIMDLGISKFIEHGRLEAMTTDSNISWQYAAPEFGDRVVSFKYDIYSLGVIIIEIVTGFTRTPDVKNVLSRWRHRWNKSNETRRYQQVAKCIEIGLMCRHARPRKRPSISQILKELDDLDCGNGAIGKVFPRWNDILWVDQPELFFPFKINKQISRSLQLHNETDSHFAFFIKTDSEFQYHVDPVEGVIQPCSHFSVDIALLAQEEAPEKMHNSYEFIVKSTRVNKSFTAEDITREIFSKKSGSLVDKIRLGVVFDARLRAPYTFEEEPKEHISLGLLEISGSQETYETTFEAESGAHSLGDHDKKFHETGETSFEAELTTHSLGDKVINFLGNHDKKQYTSAELSVLQTKQLDALERTLSNTSEDPIMLSYPVVKTITHNFAVEIGRGGFGVVYLGFLSSGNIAVKKISNSLDFDDKLFTEEVNCLIKAKHENSVRFLGYCADTQGEMMMLKGKYVLTDVRHRIMCFEYVPNGDLRQYLNEKPSRDEWHMRYKMIRGICQGLNYLHGELINHLDLKPENVMLDTQMRPKITDFGLSRHFNEGQSRVFTRIVAGTKGCIAPEAIDKGELSFKSDIFSLGITIIKILTGSNKYDLENWQNLLDVDGPEAEVCVKIAQACLDADQHKRPTIGEIIDDLNALQNE